MTHVPVTITVVLEDRHGVDEVTEDVAGGAEDLGAGWGGETGGTGEWEGGGWGEREGEGECKRDEEYGEADG